MGEDRNVGREGGYGENPSEEEEDLSCPGKL
jgi:hypothetical protein